MVAVVVVLVVIVVVIVAVIVVVLVVVVGVVVVWSGTMGPRPAAPPSITQAWSPLLKGAAALQRATQPACCSGGSGVLLAPNGLQMSSLSGSPAQPSPVQPSAALRSPALLSPGPACSSPSAE